MKRNLRSWFIRLCYMFKITKNQTPEYLSNLFQSISEIPLKKFLYSKLQLSYRIPSSLLSLPYLSWFHLELSIGNSANINAFKQKLLPFICPLENSIFNVFDQEGLKLLTRLRLGFSHLNEHRFGHNFRECLEPLCTCSLETENTSHYLLHCYHNALFCIDLMKSVKTSINIKLLLLNYIAKPKPFDCFLFD